MCDFRPDKLKLRVDVDNCAYGEGKKLFISIYYDDDFICQDSILLSVLTNQDI